MKFLQIIETFVKVLVTLNIQSSMWELINSKEKVILIIGIINQNIITEICASMAQRGIYRQILDYYNPKASYLFKK